MGVSATSMDWFYKSVLVNIDLPPSKQILPEQRTYAQDVACYDAEGNDNKRNEDR